MTVLTASPWNILRRGPLPADGASVTMFSPVIDLVRRREVAAGGDFRDARCQ